jgi:hypothetical protein
MPDPHVTTRFAPDGGLALANFVRSSDFKPELSSNTDRSPRYILTTGTFNQVVKDQFASPPERHAIGPEEIVELTLDRTGETPVPP